jgi:hypothetical protein
MTTHECGAIANSTLEGVFVIERPFSIRVRLVTVAFTVISYSSAVPRS